MSANPLFFMLFLSIPGVLGPRRAGSGVARFVLCSSSQLKVDPAVAFQVKCPAFDQGNISRPSIEEFPAQPHPLVSGGYGEFLDAYAKTACFFSIEEDFP
ncbi:hypothetical protein [Methylomagnum ishizawai]|uniref:hypothetical protein n=1 Tax=Methylomagnum ishizawai TaxID=1760988 RepID=UPI000F749E8D|nr:hypothetical protein [Methylomagnum ishizawai]